MALGLADRLGYVNLGTKLRPSVKRGYGTWVGVNLDTIRAHGPRRVGPVTVKKTLPIPKNQRGIADDFSANVVRVRTLRRPVSRV